MRVDPVLWGQGVTQTIQLSLLRKIQHICQRKSKRYQEKVVFKFYTSTRESRFCRRDPDPHYFGKLDPYLLKNKNLGALEAHNGAMEALNGGVEDQNGAVEAQNGVLEGL